MSNNDNSNSLPHLIVGAGVSGINTAVVFQEKGIPFVVFERTDVVGGVWNRENPLCGSANAGSATQSDPISYTPAGWYTTDDDRDEAKQGSNLLDSSDPFRGIHQTADTVVHNTLEIQKKHQIQVHFCRQVLSFQHNNVSDEGKVMVTWKDLASNEVHVEQFAGVHFRTGNLNKVSKVTLPHEVAFQGGPIVDGCYGRAEKLEFKDKTVVIIGWGTFAVENSLMALRKGASKVHIVARQKKPHWFDYATFVARQFYFANPDPNWGPSVWEKIFDANEKAAQACGVQDILCSSDTYTEIHGKRHLFFNKGGLPSMSIDPVALGMHYGLIEFHQGSVSDLTENAVVVSSGEEIEADVIIKCTGFDTELGPMAGHHVMDSIFVDGQANITSYHAIDGCEEDVFVGPCIPGTSSYLVSAYPLRDFDRAVVYFLQTPNKFQEFKQFPTFARFKKAEAAQFVGVMHCFNKLFAFGDENIIGNFVTSMTKKQADYEKVLDEPTFLKHDKIRWDAWSEFFATKTGKPALDYPFVDHMISGVQIEVENLRLHSSR